MNPQTAPTETQRLADLGVLAAVVTHEFNNFLNVVLLQVAVLEVSSSEEVREELSALRRQGKAAAGLIQAWQQYRRGIERSPHGTDLNEAVRSAIATTDAEPGSLVAELTDDPLPVAASSENLERLLRFLLNNSLAVSKSVRVRTRRDGETITLRVEDDGPSVSPERLPNFFHPSASARENTNRLELAACESLVRRRFRGKIHAENRDRGGITIVVRFPPSTG